jgi:hypothetical protein
VKPIYDLNNLYNQRPLSYKYIAEFPSIFSVYFNYTSVFSDFFRSILNLHRHFKYVKKKVSRTRREFPYLFCCCWYFDEESQTGEVILMRYHTMRINKRVQNSFLTLWSCQKASIPVIYRIKSLTHFTTHVDNEIRIIKISKWLVLSIELKVTYVFEVFICTFVMSLNKCNFYNFHLLLLIFCKRIVGNLFFQINLEILNLATWTIFVLGE